jgi:hypothetical protein
MTRTRGPALPLLPLILGLLSIPGCDPTDGPGAPARSEAPTPATHSDLVAFYREWREFQKPIFTEGVPDYTAEAMARQHRELAAWQARLASMDTAGWSVAEKVDWHLVRAEMNGLDFDHRVLRPWERMPWFYVMLHPEQSDVPAHEGPFLAGWIDTWTYEYPLSPEDAAELAGRIGAIPAILEQARGNLTGDAHDLWLGGIRAIRRQSTDLAGLGERVAGTSADLVDAIDRAREATDAFVAWLEEEAPGKTGPSGVGKENYTWYVRNVHLVPFTWEELVGLHRRELARSQASLKLEEERNRALPPRPASPPPRSTTCA